MDFYDRFELLDLVSDDGVKTFEALERATGRPVRVHLFVAPKAPLQAALLKALDQLPAWEAARIIDRGKNEGTPFVVTDRLADQKSLQDWVLKSTPPKQVRAAEPGEFTRIFQAQGAPAPSDPTNTAKPAATGVGEFTRMFQSPPSGQPGRAAGTAKAAEGEFTQFFRPPAAAGPLPINPVADKVTDKVTDKITPPGPASAGANRIGEFTRMFGKPDQPELEPLPPAPATPSLNTSQAGPFSVAKSGLPTQTMPVSAQQLPMPQPKPASAELRQLTRAGQNPVELPFGQAGTSKFTVPAAPLTPVAPQFSAAPNVTPPSAGAPPVATPGAATGSNLPLLLGMAVIVFLAVLVIFYFAVGKRP